MPGHDIIVIGASAGGVEALSLLVSALPADLSAAIFVVLHVPPHATSVLPRILSRAGNLPAHHALNGQPIENGHIYIAPPDHHLLLEAGRLHLSRGPSENGHRPAVDPLFRSAARVYGLRVIGVILTGALDDGTAGLSVVKARGGLAVVQHPEEAYYSGMPQSAVDNVPVDYILSLAEISDILPRLTRQETPANTTGEPSVSSGKALPGNALKVDLAMAEFDENAIEHQAHIGQPSVYTCPECHGTLWEVHEEDLIRFRCRVGHAYSVDSLLAAQAEALESALWTAYRALEESAALSQRMADRALKAQSSLAERFALQAEETRQRAQLIREALLREAGSLPLPGMEQNAPAHPPRLDTLQEMENE